MTIPLPEPAGVIIVGTQALRAFTADQLRAYGDARAAEERERTKPLIEECRAALAEELAGYDINPPLHHVLQAHNHCDKWLAAAIRKGE